MITFNGISLKERYTHKPPDMGRRNSAVANMLLVARQPDHQDTICRLGDRSFLKLDKISFKMVYVSIFY